jgi:hypothetical protein
MSQAVQWIYPVRHFCHWSSIEGANGSQDSLVPSRPQKSLTSIKEINETTLTAVFFLSSQ